MDNNIPLEERRGIDTGNIDSLQGHGLVDQKAYWAKLRKDPQKVILEAQIGEKKLKTKQKVPNPVGYPTTKPVSIELVSSFL